MPRRVIPKGSYDKNIGGPFQSSEVRFTIILVYDQTTDDVCEDFAQTADEAWNDMIGLGVKMDVGRPLAIDTTDPVLFVASASDPASSTSTVPMICEGIEIKEDRDAKIWRITGIYRAVEYADPGHVFAKVVSAPREVTAWRIGDTSAITWSFNTSTQSWDDPLANASDIGGVKYDINTNPRTTTIEGWQAEFSFIIRSPYYATYAATTLTEETNWINWTVGDASTTVGKRNKGTEWNESPVATWATGEWIVSEIMIDPINTVDHKVTVRMRYDEWQLCDQVPGQAYGGPIFPGTRPSSPTVGTDPLLLAAEYVFWANPYPLGRDAFVAGDLPYGVFDFISTAFTA